jgi:acetyltransferase-like isoleucine patch superfamily enzyme
MSKPILSINIPTYNRVGYLKQALESLIPQKTEEVEINVTDNHSTDGTWEYLESLHGVVNRIKPPKGTNGNYNILSCAEIGTGLYTWVHCDDDIARLNAVDNILRAIREFDFPPALTFDWDSYNKDMDGFQNSRVDAIWERCNKIEFLEKISYKFTFASAIILKRGAMDFEYVKSHSPLNLIPANMIFSTVGRTNDVVLTKTPLLAARGNPGNSDLLTTFTKDMWLFFDKNKALGYPSELIEKVYDSSLRTVVCWAVDGFRVTWASALMSFLYSFRFRSYYTHVLPKICYRLTPPFIKSIFRGVRSALNFAWSAVKRCLKYIVFIFAWFVFKKIIELFSHYKPTETYGFLRRIFDRMATEDFRTRTGTQNRAMDVRHPTYMFNPNYVKVGSRFFAGPGLRIETFDKYHDQTFNPSVTIGDNVFINWNCHIGAINAIEIHDNVLIGSNVLITDHSHGFVDSRDLSMIPANRPLVSKGPVVIERDVWIGEGVSILSGVRIGEGAIIGANSVITGDVPKFSVVGGVPARVIKSILPKTAI